jgi:adenosylmethionine-8-amino-7-oxononanoate aminotransferase
MLTFVHSVKFLRLTQVPNDKRWLVSAQRSLRLLDAVHRQPPVQEGAAHVRGASKDMHYTTTDGRQVLDGTAGLWCVNAGHCRPKIVEAIQQQAASWTTRRRSRWAIPRPSSWPIAGEHRPKGMNHVFFTNSGSESVETALKMALAYHRVRAKGSRTA